MLCILFSLLCLTIATYAADSIHSEELFKPRQTLNVKAKPSAKARALRVGKHWHITGRAPLTVEFTPVDREAWDISSFRLVGIPFHNRSSRAVTVAGKLINGGLTGWSHHAVGLAIAPATEQAILGFPFPISEGRYRGHDAFRDQLAKPNGHRVHWRQFFPEDVRSIRMEINSATGPVDLLIDDPFLAWPATAELDRKLEAMPYVDELGQVRAVDWPGKAKDIKEVRETLYREFTQAAEEAKTRKLSRFGGWLDGPKRKATGHFRTEKVDGRWWFIDPEGHLFFSVGACLAGHESMTVINQKRLNANFFQWLPDDKDYLRWAGRKKRGEREFANFPAMNLQRAFGEEWKQRNRWGIHNRMRAWGLNTFGAWTDQDLQKDSRTPYTLVASIWWQSSGHRKFPSPFRPDFEDDLRKALQNHAWAKDDPFLLGVFIGNELEWPDRLTPKVFEMPESDYTKSWVRDRLKQKYISLDALNDAWKTEHVDWNKVLTKPIPKAAGKDIEPFYLDFTTAFFSRCKKALNAELPNKLYLGCRTHRGPNVLGRGAAGHVDAFSVNVYDSRVRSWQVPGDVDIPILAGEFHFGAVDRGVPSPGLSGSWNQRQRGLSFACYLASALADPRFVGVHWFQWIDQSAAGRSDRENHQCGFVDVAGRAYPEFTSIVSRVTEGMYRARLNQSGHLPILDELVSDPEKKKQAAAREKAEGETWKNEFFKKHPKADTNRDGKLTWYELQTFQQKGGK